MIEYFLKETLPRYHDINPADVNVIITHKNSPFSEVDNKACDEAKQKRKSDGTFDKFENICSSCDHVVLRVDNNGQDIHVVEFEKYVNSLPNRIINGQKRCDLLMTDGTPHNKIVFCDLCCYDEVYIEPNRGKHPEGKRAEARKKMEESVEMLLSVQMLDHYILTYPNKVCLFAYRSYNSVAQPVMAQKGNAKANMQAMLTTASSVSGQVITQEQVMNHNFTFVQNKYPSIYIW